MALWTPAQITTALWLDGSDSSTLFDATSGGSSVAANGSIARWQDKSGNTRHVTQSTASQRPTRLTNQQNELDLVSFDADDFLSNTTAALLRNIASYQVFAVANSTASMASVERTLLQVDTNLTNTRFLFAKQINTGNALAGGRRLSSNSFQSVVSGSAISTMSVWSSTVSHSATTIEGYINGTQFGLSTSYQTSGNTENDAGRLFVGANVLGLSFWNGTIGEIVIVQSSSSTETRQLVEGYLAWKWGLQANLPSDHPYKNGAPSVGGSRRKFGSSLFRSTLFNAGLAR